VASPAAKRRSSISSISSGGPDGDQRGPGEGCCAGCALQMSFKMYRCCQLGRNARVLAKSDPGGKMTTSGSVSVAAFALLSG